MHKRREERLNELSIYLKKLEQEPGNKTCKTLGDRKLEREQQLINLKCW